MGTTGKYKEVKIYNKVRYIDTELNTELILSIIDNIDLSDKKNIPIAIEKILKMPFNKQIQFINDVIDILPMSKLEFTVVDFNLEKIISDDVFLEHKKILSDIIKKYNNKEETIVSDLEKKYDLKIILIK